MDEVAERVKAVACERGCVFPGVTEVDASRNKRRLDAHLHRLQQEKAHEGRSKEEGRLTAEERAILIAEIQAVNDGYTY